MSEEFDLKNFEKKVSEDLNKQMDHAEKWSEISLWMSIILILLVAVLIIANFVKQIIS